MSKKVIDKSYDVVVVGGGLSGLCAAIASSRQGSKTALIQNRAVLGGNASSEIRMHICGADVQGNKPDRRETGIIEEILLENRLRNPNDSFSVFDTVMWEKARYQENLDLYLNTHMNSVNSVSNRINSISAFQMTTEKEFEFSAKVFIDATGDGYLAHLADAESMSGREGKNTFGENYAPDETDHVCMGNTLLFKAVDIGRTTPFIKPFWANTYSEDELSYRDHQEFTSGYWWIELGGDILDVTSDGEELRDELLKAVYGVWDHIKNSGHHNADNFTLDWVGFLPGKRESRRIVGEYILREQDLLHGRRFDDAIAYGGWPMDMHVVGGLRTRLEPTMLLDIEEIYDIPYRSIVSKNVSNLILGGRAISVSHMAFGSTRVMATCAIVGQAGGTAAAMSVEKGIEPKDLANHIKELQQILLKDDCFIPGIKNTDDSDIARGSSITCSSSKTEGVCTNIINGVSRKEKNESNCWISDGLSTDGEWIDLDFKKEVLIREIHLKFDSNLSNEIMPTLSHSIRKKQISGIPHEIVKDFTLEFYMDNKLIYIEKVHNNYKRFVKYLPNVPLKVDRLRLLVKNTYGCEDARVFEVRVY